MAKINYKNKLQELLQAAKLPTPKYRSMRVGGEDHSPLWKSTVNFEYQGVKRRFKGSPFGSKILAEMNVAMIAYSSVKKKEPPKPITNTNVPTTLPSFLGLGLSKPKSNRKVVLIDVENQPNATANIINKLSTSEKIDIICVISEDHPTGKKVVADPRIKLLEIPSTRKNSADIGLAMYTTKLLLEGSYDQYYIISGDSFAGVVVDCINGFKEIGGQGVTGVLCRNETKFLSLLK